MRTSSTPWLVLLPALMLALALGCQRARVYNPRSAPKAEEKQAEKPSEPEQEKEIPPGFGWMDTGRDPTGGDVPIEFIIQQPDNAAEWQALKGFWNDVGLVDPKERAAVKIKVPLGLDDPLLPAANPPTRARWSLGRRLFFDPTWLTDKGNVSCATCHRPSEGFSDGKKTSGGDFNAPVLINLVYHTHFFWDGRAGHLEEVVQASLSDERAPKQPASFRHVWPGVIARLRASRAYKEEFNIAFGVAPTQDGVGRAIATYLRTLLAADSLYDRAVVQSKQARWLAAAHFEAVLDDAALVALGKPKADKQAVAAELARGAELFRGKAECSRCHPMGGGTFSDGRFHNIGIAAPPIDPTRGQWGRFSVAPYGEKNRWQIGAYKTPTLRGLSRSAPYFHNGSAADLAAAVRAHVKPPINAPRNLYLTPLLATADGAPRDFGLSEDEIQALVLFLKALDGQDVDRAVASPPP